MILLIKSSGAQVSSQNNYDTKTFKKVDYIFKDKKDYNFQITEDGNIAQFINHDDGTEELLILKFKHNINRMLADSFTVTFIFFPIYELLR